MEWHNILEPQDPELDRLAERYHLHQLHIEDCRHRNQSAKVEESNGYRFTVLKHVRTGPDGRLRTGDLDIFLGPDFVITVIEDQCPELQDLMARVRQGATGSERADQLYYRMVDQLVDSYLPLLDQFSDHIDDLQDRALESPAPETVADIFEAKRDVIVLRRVLVNTRDVAGFLQRNESPLVGRDMWPFFRDVYDHVARNLDTVEMLRDLLSGALDVYLSSVANRTNQVMKVLTVLSTIALPALVISSIYGMNLPALPWSHSPYGVVVVFALMFAGTGLLLYVLKRYDWL